ncbi:ATP-binding protein, partial [Actinopolymorpha alba]|uniref:ATP-binding protein n=1 Tax=Actinopolymorpha alba TaxID=533267 RepID=UPI0012F647B4
MSRATGYATKTRAGNLPVDATSFVGRRSELAEVRRILSTARLVTLTGVGGVGKTRLALRVAAGLQRAFPDGAWLVDLTLLSDPRLLAQTVAEALEIREQSRRDPMDILADYLSDRHMLLILDNCEQLSQASAMLADRLLRAAPGLRILATSRQRLNVATEHTVAVPPLSLPKEFPRAGAGGAFAPSEAVLLFTERATAARYDFVLSEDNKDAVVGICQRLEGIPLAIELAAARLRSLSPEQILERLDDRYRLLTAGPKNVAPRHQTLRALIDWSYDLCTPAEQRFWARSAIFAGSFDLAATEAVCADDTQPEDVIDLVTELIDKSILVREEHAGQARYRQLDLIRQYGRHRLTDL